VAITPADVEHIARLARLALDATEVERMAAQLSSILEHMRELSAVDVAGVAPFAIAAEDVSAPRADHPGADPLQLPLRDFAAAWKEGFFTVPQLEAQRGPRAPEAS
jgi:aspartyl-tRNA(Asn)/glutamyl-tRNA(Gln) amidotransferase subunit C